ncbi:HNH endonuclease [Phycicoccus sonneratiae]|uniref:HNH endonuclease n=1 Tax=Phycicoccus sonneratiae TaxID=2807628 RepID=A0ABS2CK64_9MICO|nr:HNH endonuclease [Phycicoccus sonneraticus]MBM6400278.1 HNH endonuclease [Phycicoccus sonneraticus]
MTTDPAQEDSAWIAAEVARDLALETGLELNPAMMDADGFHGWAIGYSAQVEDGYAFDLLLAVGYRSSEATLRPGRFSGRLVRSFATGVSADPQAWKQQWALAMQGSISATVYADDEMILAPERLPSIEFRTVEIECVAKSSGTSVLERKLATLIASRAALSLFLVGLDLQAQDSGEILTEGASVRVAVNKYERNPVARMQCIAHYGSSCWVCDVSFAKYGEIGDGYIHVHHRVLVSSFAGASYVVDPIRDLVPLCPNCHMMIHRRNPPLEPAALRGILGLPSKPPLPAVSPPQ